MVEAMHFHQDLLLRQVHIPWGSMMPRRTLTNTLRKKSLQHSVLTEPRASAVILPCLYGMHLRMILITKPTTSQFLLRQWAQRLFLMMLVYLAIITKMVTNTYTYIRKIIRRVIFQILQRRILMEKPLSMNTKVMAVCTVTDTSHSSRDSVVASCMAMALQEWLQTMRRSWTPSSVWICFALLIVPSCCSVRVTITWAIFPQLLIQ